MGGVAVGAYIATRQSQSGSDTVGRKPSKNPIRDTEAGKALREFLAVIYNQGDGAAQAYDQALERLRAHGEGVAAEIAYAEPLLREGDYPGRWALIFAACELRSPAALPYLQSFALSRIPAERSPDPHSFSTVAEETILRTTAIEGIGRLARENNARAVEALFECLARPVISMRRAAVQELLAAPDGQKQRDRIAAALPDDQRFLLDLRRIDVHQVPQVRYPEQFLAPALREPSSMPPPHDATHEGQGTRQPVGNNPPPTLRPR
jgi:hypothetical protein